MIGLAFNNPTINVGYLEYNRMRELNVSEIKEVTGGTKLVDFVVSYVGGKILDAATDADWGKATYEDMMIAP